MLYLRCLLQIQSKDYFPVQIVRAIVVQSLSGQEMDDAALVSSLMEVMSEVDQGLVENIRNGQLADNDEEMMDDFIIRVRSDSNAKRELDCWGPPSSGETILIQEPYLVMTFGGWQINPDIPTIYPTTQSFLSSMGFGDLQLLDHKVKNIVKWLKKYIKAAESG